MTSRAEPAAESKHGNACSLCLHRHNPQGGHCYMFREEPEVCLQYASERQFEKRATGDRNEPLIRLFIMGRLCDVYGCWDSSDSYYSGDWLDLDTIRDVETGAYWPDDVVLDLADTSGDGGLFDAIELEAYLQAEQIEELRWPIWYHQPAAMGEAR